jgi:hypothetical protein
MITRQETRTILYYRSSVVDVETESIAMVPFIEWADANPIAWKIVMDSKSKAFGINSTNGGNSSSSGVLPRLEFLKCESERADPFWGWRARFTLEHYMEKGFKSGFFQQWDGTYHRGCSSLDYTPATLDEVVSRFLAWCDIGWRQDGYHFHFPTVEVRLNKKTIRTYSPPTKTSPTREVRP